MTLLELLVKELPKRGGWPDNDTYYVSQDRNGSVWSYSLKPVLKNERWDSEGFIRYIFDGESKPLSFDWGSSVISPEQYEAAIAAQQPVWDGEGLPPAGVECEYIGNDTSWGVVKVIGYDEGRVVFKPSGEDYYGIIPGYKSVFRHIRTEADRKREAEVDELIDAITLTLTDIYASQRFMDAIAAGKIPGVELTK